MKRFKISSETREFPSPKVKPVMYHQGMIIASRKLKTVLAMLLLTGIFPQVAQATRCPGPRSGEEKDWLELRKSVNQKLENRTGLLFVFADNGGKFSVDDAIFVEQGPKTNFREMNSEVSKKANAKNPQRKVRVYHNENYPTYFSSTSVEKLKDKNGKFLAERVCKEANKNAKVPEKMAGNQVCEDLPASALEATTLLYGDLGLACELVEIAAKKLADKKDLSSLEKENLKKAITQFNNNFASKFSSELEKSGINQSKSKSNDSPAIRSSTNPPTNVKKSKAAN